MYEDGVSIWFLVRIVLFYILLGSGIGAVLGKPKGLLVDGIVYGLLLGPIGWIIVLLKSPTVEAQLKRDQELRGRG